MCTGGAVGIPEAQCFGFVLLRYGRCVHRSVHNWCDYLMIILVVTLFHTYNGFLVLFILCCVAFVLKDAYLPVDGTDRYKN